MKMTELLRYDVPPEIIALWQSRESESLLPLQELAVKRHDLFGGGNLLIQAPTSSGKTFIGEMAALQTALRLKKVVYLVPLKALAEEKYRDFKEKYQDYGLKVIVSSRDHREYDADFEDGNFSIAVVVYEKLAQLLVRRPERIEEIDLVIADELELLSDPERGATVELLLTHVLRGGRRIIGLSAVIGGADRLAEWLDAKLIQHERRPVELRYGVLHEGIFKYRTYNEFGEGAEALAEGEGASTWEALTQNVCVFTGRGETCLIFVKSKHESRRGAELLAGRIDHPAALHAIDALRSLEATRCRDSLMTTLNSGVAFHNADLSPEERGIVERAFRDGEVLALVSTSTLAVGLNMPTQNVFISADKWRYDQRLDIPWKTPILRSEYENMGGRAGRYGAGHAFGRSILIAATPFDQETLWRRYIDGEREHIDPQLAKGALENHVLRLVAARVCRSAEELLGFLESTLSGKWIWTELYTVDEIAFRIRGALNRCTDAGVLSASAEGRLEATPLGRVVAAKGISIATARELEYWIGQCETRDWPEIDLIYAAAATPDGRMLQVLLSAREYDCADYAGRIRGLMRDDALAADTPINRIRNCTLQPFFEEVRAIKAALFLNEWIDHAAVRDLEESYNTMAGQILSAAEQTSWLIDTTGAIATALGAGPAFIEKIHTLASRVQWGVRNELLPLAWLDAPGLHRSLLIELHGRNLHSPEALLEIPDRTLREIVPAPAAKLLKAWARAQEEPVPAEGNGKKAASAPIAPILLVDDREPGGIHLEGTHIPLQEKQYRLIRLLARHPGACVPYETIYHALWGDDIIVEQNQMHFQKRKLIQALSTACPQHDRLITTTPKRGFVLHLDAEQVFLKSESFSQSS